MKRLDLTADCHGWQVIDATPQELSEDAYRCGPASVAAVKRAEIHRPYDNNFVFAEVNADKVFWRYNGPSQPLKLVRKDIYGQVDSHFSLSNMYFLFHPSKEIRGKICNFLVFERKYY